MAKRLSRSRRAAMGNTGSAPRANTQAAAVQATPEDMSDQYSYVVRDLSRVGIIALVLIGGLIALSFFLK